MARKKMRIAFFGTPDFAAEILRCVLDETDHDVVGVVSKPDRQKGRGLHIIKTPVKSLAEERGLRLEQPQRASLSVEKIAAFGADVFLVVAYGEILSSELLHLPEHGAYNVHASLLPAYRGAAPIERALLDGCRETGVTLFRLKPKMDAGDIVWQHACAIGANVTSGELRGTLLEMAKKGVVSLLRDLADGTVSYCKQSEEGVSMAPKIASHECRLDPSDSVAALHNRVRAFSPKPGAYMIFEYKGKEFMLKVLRTHIDTTVRSERREWGRMDDGSLALRTCDGALVFDRVRPEGRREMTSADFLRGHDVHDIFFVS